MGFYHLCGFGSAFNNIRVNGSLSQEFNSFQFSGLFFKDTDKFTADNLAFFLRICNSLQFFQETIRCVHIDQIGMQLVLKYFYDTFRFVFPHQTMVDMNTNQLFSDGFDQHGRHYGGIHAAGQRQKYFSVPHLFPDQFHLIFNKVFHVPVGLCMAHIKHKFLQQRIIRHCILFPGTFCRGMVKCNHGITTIIQCGIDIHRRSIHNTVFATVEHDSLYVLQSVQFLCRNVVGMNLTVYPQLPDLPGNRGILCASQVKNDYHILFHTAPSCCLLSKNIPFRIISLYFHHIIRRRLPINFPPGVFL